MTDKSRKTILAALDLSEATAAILRQVAGLAHALRARVWIIHVAEPDPEFVSREVDPEVMRDDLAGDYRKEHRELQRLAEDLRNDGLETTALLVQGPTSEKILEEARRLGADLIVVGSYGKGGVRRLLFGSTSEDVLQSAGVPVLVVPTHEQALNPEQG
jgi:nucleotide-binding universal stress UspA family protein